MTFQTITPSDERWESVQNYAANCSWRAGRFLAEAMEQKAFQGWERVIICLDRDVLCGFCTAAKTDCLPDVSYTPYIGYLYVDEAYRGRRLSQQMIRFAINYLKSVGFDRVYLVSDHENLYEKYGFRVIDRQMAPWGSEEKIYMQEC